MASEEQIEQIKAQADIVDIIGEFLPLRKRGGNYITLSPFTKEKTPSFVVSPDKQIFKDFSSGKGGNVYRFLMDYQGWSFPEALEFVAGKVGIELKKSHSGDKKEFKRTNALKAIEMACQFFEKQLKEKRGEIAFNYFLKRGFSLESVEKFRLGYCPDEWTDTFDHLSGLGVPMEAMADAGLIGLTRTNKPYDFFKGRAMFPIRNKSGKVIGFGGRLMRSDQQGGKYINTRDTILYDKSKTIYGLYEANNAILRKESCILVEGYADVISLHQHGFDNVVASSGTALTEEQVSILSRITDDFFINYDSDAAGQKASSAVIDAALKKGLNVKVIKLPDGEDPDSIVQKHGKNTFSSFLRDALDFVEFKINNFKLSNDINQPNLRSKLLRDLIGSVKSIPDRLQHDHYIGKISSLLGLNENEIRSLYSEKKKIEKSNFESKPKLVRDNREEASESLDDQKLKLEEIPIEDKYILTYALQSYEQYDKMLDMEDFKIEDLRSSLSREIFNTINEGIDRDSNLLSDILDSEFVDQSMKNTISGIVLLDNEVSELLTKNMQVDFEKNINEELKRAIYQLKILNLNDELNKVQKSLSEDPENLEILKSFSELNSKKIEFEEKLEDED